MAGINDDPDQFNCVVCLDLLKDPVTIPCGHNFCKVCIHRFWDGEDQKKLYSCPQCRHTFSPRPVLGRNNMLADVVEKLKRIEFQSAFAGHSHAGPGEVKSDSCGVKKSHSEDSCLGSPSSYCEDQIQSRSQSPAFKKLKLAESREELQDESSSEQTILNECYGSTDQSCKIRLCTVDKYQSPDPGSAKLSFPTLSVPLECDDSLSFTVNQYLSTDGTREDLSDDRDEEKCEEKFNHISPHAAEFRTSSSSEPKDREDFLQYFCYLLLDPNTAHHQLILSEKNRKAKHSIAPQRYSGHPERFVSRSQVMCKESVCGRCYWEVEWSGCVSISVSYKDISRRGESNKCGFGYNSQSWSLRCSSSSVSFWHNDIQTKLQGQASSRIGVYVDHGAGTLSFYSVSDTMKLLHRVHTTFTKPLYAGFRIWYNSTMRLFDLNVSQSV